MEIKQLPLFTPTMNSIMENFIQALFLSAWIKSSLPMNGNCGLLSKNTWNIGTTIVPTLGLMGKWYCHTHRMQTERFKKFQSSAVCFTAIAG